jgi:histidyl-tRNA synthetase
MKDDSDSHPVLILRLCVVLGYYTGPVFEIELNIETEDENGEIARFGSVGGGGRYDDLVKRFKGIEIPATGISIGVSRLGCRAHSTWQS